VIGDSELVQVSEFKPFFLPCSPSVLLIQDTRVCVCVDGADAALFGGVADTLVVRQPAFTSASAEILEKIELRQFFSSAMTSLLVVVFCAVAVTIGKLASASSL
jgi:hypothetical protein